MEAPNRYKAPTVKERHGDAPGSASPVAGLTRPVERSSKNLPSAPPKLEAKTPNARHYF